MLARRAESILYTIGVRLENGGVAAKDLLELSCKVGEGEVAIYSVLDLEGL